ncbi:MAG: CoA transferase [Dehalococcoidales bacterium]|nr:CoA transferase [Dehalococcoidales bacterium]
MAGALSGIRVLDLGRFIASPFCGLLLADLGADVIRIERPGGNEDRFMGFQMPIGYTYGFANLNRNKRAITLNFEKTDRGKEILLDLVKQSDVVVHNFSPEAAKAIGVTYENFKTAKPDIIFARVSAFGTTGPYQHRIGFDQIMKGVSGAMSISGFPSTPTKEQVPHIDYMTASLTALGIVSAIYHRAQTGEGQVIDTSLLQTGVTFMANFIAEWELAKVRRPQIGNRSHFVGPTDLYATKDGRWVMLCIQTNSIWRRFCRHIGREDLLKDPRFKDDFDRWGHRDIIDPIVAQWAASQTAAEIVAVSEKIPIPCGICYDQSEVASDPQVKAMEVLSQVPFPDGSTKVNVTSPPIRMSASPTKIYRSFPTVGQDNEAIFGKLLGYSKAELAKLKEEGVI